MKYLIDTHIFLWYIDADPRLNISFYKTIENAENEIFISTAAVWELIIKASIGKFKSEMSIIEFISKYCLLHNIQIIDLTIDDLNGLEYLPQHHKDPFDRLMIVQSKNRKMIFISDDAIVKKYFE